MRYAIQTIISDTDNHASVDYHGIMALEASTACANLTLNGTNYTAQALPTGVLIEGHISRVQLSAGSVAVYG
jgi:hypothetical protein